MRDLCLHRERLDSGSGSVKLTYLLLAGDSEKNYPDLSLQPDTLYFEGPG